MLAVMLGHQKMFLESQDYRKVEAASSHSLKHKKKGGKKPSTDQWAISKLLSRTK